MSSNTEATTGSTENFHNFYSCSFLGKLLKCSLCINMESGLITYHDPFSHLLKKLGKKQEKNSTWAKKIIMFLFVVKKTKAIIATELWPARKTQLHFEKDVFSIILGHRCWLSWHDLTCHDSRSFIKSCRHHGYIESDFLWLDRFDTY